MQYQQWIDDCNLLCGWMLRELGQLQEAIEHSKGYAYYLEVGESPTAGDDARQAATKYLNKLSHADFDDGLEKTQDVFAAVCVSPETILLAEHINVIKTEFREFHEALRSSFGTGKEATEAMRLVLKRCGHARLNLEAADRLIPTIVADVKKISWHYNSTPPSRRQTLAQAITALRELQDSLGEANYDAIEEDIRHLEAGHYPMSLPVAQILRSSTVKALHLTYSFINKDGERVKERVYGKNPALILDSGTMVLCLPPKEITGEGVVQGRGRKKIISERPVSQFLRNWFFYDQPPETESNKPPRKKQNVAAKTKVSGVWFALSRHGKLVFAFKNENGKRTTRSIDRYGVKEAWCFALDNMENQLPNDTRESMKCSPPDEEDIKGFLASVREYD